VSLGVYGRRLKEAGSILPKSTGEYTRLDEASPVCEFVSAREEECIQSKPLRMTTGQPGQ